LAELGRLLGDQTEPVSLTVTPQRNQILFHLSNIDLVSQLLDGQFPDYNAIVPQSTVTQAVVDTGLLLKACKAANVFAREAANLVTVSLRPGDQTTPGQITLGAQSAETGDNVGELEATITGSPLELAFNIRYLIDVLHVIGADHLSFETVDAVKACLIRPIGDDTFTHVIMPMHTHS
jgi:DNA polymerase III subunit beta